MFFNRKHSLVASGILQGRTDIHCHILPAVDDGAPSFEDSLQLLDYLEQLGYAEVWFTPHVMEGLGNTTAKLQPLFAEFRQKYAGPLKLHLAAEYMMDEGFGERLATDALRLGREHLLIETSYINSPVGLDDIILSVWKKGFRPLIAHPERYMYMEDDDYRRLKGNGYDFQLNLLSLSGYYGLRPKVYAERLLEQGMYDYVGTDIHHLERYTDYLSQLKLKRRQLDAIAQLLENNASV